MSAEHVWGEWIGRLFSDYQEFYTVEHGANPDTARRWKSRSIDAKVYVPCEHCNNGWMSDLEVQTSSLLSNMIRYGSAVSLLPLGIATVAAFAVKTAVIVDCASGLRQPFFSHLDRHNFAKTLAIPDGVQIWLSTFRSKRLHGRYHGAYTKVSTGRFKGFKLYVFTFVVGFFAFQLAAFRWESITKRPSLCPYLEQAPIFDPVSIMLWPSRSPVTWPTKQYLTSDSIQVFAHRWSRVSEEIP